MIWKEQELRDYIERQHCARIVWEHQDLHYIIYMALLVQWCIMTTHRDHANQTHNRCSMSLATWTWTLWIAFTYSISSLDPLVVERCCNMPRRLSTPIQHNENDDTRKGEYSLILWPPINFAGWRESCPTKEQHARRTNALLPVGW